MQQAVFCFEGSRCCCQLLRLRARLLQRAVAARLDVTICNGFAAGGCARASMKIEGNGSRFVFNLKVTSIWFIS
jgi:hypothetical protein